LTSSNPTDFDSDGSEAAPKAACRKAASSPFRLFVHGICLSLLALAWLVDRPVYEAVNSWYNSPEPINGELHQLILSLAMYGQMLGIALSILLILILDHQHRRRALVLGMVLLTTGLSCTILKALIGRERPLGSQGQTVLHGAGGGLLESRNHSFPSGHAATGFALTCTLARFYPQTAPLVWILGYGVAANRVLTVRHYLSDVAAGAWFGYMMATMLLQSGWIWRLADRLVRLTSSIGVMGTRCPRWDRGMFRRKVRQILASPILLVVVSLTIHWIGNGETALWDRDEPRFATATREMIERSDWIVPTFNGELRPDKPILIYWLMGLAYSVFGEGEFAARFFSGLAGTASCLVAYGLARKMFDKRVALVSAWILALSPMLIIESKLATVDAVLLLWLTTMLWSIWSIWQASEKLPAPGSNRESRWPAFLFWLALGLGILTKGPVAVAIPAMAIGLFCVLKREYRWIGRFHFKWGAGLALCVVLPWCVAVHQATDGDFLRLALGHHVVRRSTEALEGHGGPPGYYLFSLLATMAPWACLIPWAAGKHWGRFRSDDRIALLAAWSCGTLAMFEAVQTKLVHYILPAFPALAILVGAALAGRFAGERAGYRSFRFAIGRPLAYLAAFAGIVAIGAILAIFPSDVYLPAVATITVLAGGTAIAAMLVHSRRLRHAFIIQCLAMATGWMVAGDQLLPKLSQHRLILEVARRIKKIRSIEPVALWQYRDPSLVFYNGAPLPVIDEMRIKPFFPDALEYARRNGSFLCPMTAKEYELMSRDGALDLSIVETVQGWDLQRCRQRGIHLVRVRPSANVAQIVRLRDQLRNHAPDVVELNLPLFDESRQRAVNSRRRYPLNSAFLDLQNKQIK